MSAEDLIEKKPRTVALVTLGCARNEVDSEELAGRLSADGWTLVDDPALAEVALINTCGFIESAKKDSVDALLEAHSLKGNGTTKAVVAVGCMAERYGNELSQALPEADAILGFDDYQDISLRLQTIINGGSIAAHTPKDRRALLPIAPAERAKLIAPAEKLSRKRLENTPIAPLKIASGCDRRCSFCAIPMFRGAFISRRPVEIIEEAKWLADQGVSELFLVSENTTSYGKDFRDMQVLENMLPEISNIAGVERIRLSYLQPAEMRPSLIQAMISVPKVLPYFDLSFQHASPTVLRRMRRFGDTQSFLHLISQIRALAPQAGIRSNVIVGFPGETDAEFEELINFLSQARLDAIGVFGYSDEDKTEALTLEDKVDQDVINSRVELLSKLVDEFLMQRAEERIGEHVRVLIEDEESQEGRAEHQGPEVDGSTFVKGRAKFKVGEYVDAIVTEVSGVDLIAVPL
ncbi:MiaB 2-methylthioadenine synthetase [actinobacterium SCGC AAA044-D11]